LLEMAPHYCDVHSGSIRLSEDIQIGSHGVEGAEVVRYT
jgi:hypothetical protein